MEICQEKCKRMKRQFVKQYDDNGCGPISIINAKRWKGQLPPFYKKLRAECKTGINGYDGTLQMDMDQTIRKYFSNVGCTNSPRRMRFALENGHGIILLYHFEEETEKGDHYVFVYQNSKGIWVSNDRELCVIGPLTWRKFQNSYLDLRQTRETYKMVFPTGWVIQNK